MRSAVGAVGADRTAGVRPGCSSKDVRAILEEFDQEVTEALRLLRNPPRQ